MEYLLFLTRTMITFLAVTAALYMAMSISLWVGSNRFQEVENAICCNRVPIGIT